MRKQACRADNLDAYVQRMLARRYVDSKRRGWAARVRLVWPAPEPAPPPDEPGRADDRDAVLKALRRLPPGRHVVDRLQMSDDGRTVVGALRVPGTVDVIEVIRWRCQVAG